MRLLLVVGLLALTTVALAQDPTPEQLIEHGIALREDGRDEEALAIFHRAYDAEPSGQAMAQIALAEHALGRLVDAEAHLVLALGDADDRFVRRNRAPLEQALEEIRTQLTDLTLTEGVVGATVTIDGVERGTMPLGAPLRVQAGTAHLEVHAEGHQGFAREVIVQQGVPLTLAVVLPPIPRAVEPEPVTLPEPEPEPIAPPPSAPAWRLTTGVALAAAGVVGIAIASGLMAWREDAARTRQTCSDTDPGCRALYGTAVDAETAGIATFVVSGLLAAAGGAILAWHFLDARPSAQTTACAPIGPPGSPAGIGLGVACTF